MNPTFYAYFGGILLFLMCSIILGGIVISILDKLHRSWEAWTWSTRRLAFHEVGKRILCETYYFSASPETVLAMEALGEALRDSDGWRIEQVEELWSRKMRDYAMKKEAELLNARTIVAAADKREGAA